MRHRVLLWLLWAHVAAMPVISLLFDQGSAQAALDCATVGFLAVLAQLKLGGRRAQSLIVTLGLLTMLGADRPRLRRPARSPTSTSS